MKVSFQSGVRLTAQQHAVVTHDTGHARVAAVAGAGKTTTMAARVLHLLEQGVSPKRMLVLMFNRSAKDDFLRRIDVLILIDNHMVKKAFHPLA